MDLSKLSKVAQLLKPHFNLHKFQGAAMNMSRASQGFERLDDSWENEDDDEPVTHTGQKFGKDDFRKLRFDNNNIKLVEPKQKWPIEMIHEVPPKVVSEAQIACDGGGGALGHPVVYINLDKPGDHACGYCGLRFVLGEDAREHPET